MAVMRAARLFGFWRLSYGKAHFYFCINNISTQPVRNGEFAVYGKKRDGIRALYSIGLPHDIHKVDIEIVYDESISRFVLRAWLAIPVSGGSGEPLLTVKFWENLVEQPDMTKALNPRGAVQEFLDGPYAYRIAEPIYEVKYMQVDFYDRYGNVIGGSSYDIQTVTLQRVSRKEFKDGKP